MKRNVVFVIVGLLALMLCLILLPIGEAQRAHLERADTQTPNASTEPTYRSPGDRHKVRVSDEATARLVEGQGGRLIGDYESFKIYETNSAGVDSLAANRELEVRDEDNLVQLNAGAFDTTTPEAQALRKPAGLFSGKRMHLVQFAGPIKPEWYQALLKTGVQVVTYIPSNTYLVYGDAAGIQRVQSLAKSGGVQWDGAYEDRYRLDSTISAATSKDAAGGKIRTNKGGPTTDLYAIQMVKDPRTRSLWR